MPVLAAGTPDGIGIALVSGTGSIAFGKNSHNETARAGGWGYRLGDQGSGYDIAMCGLRAIVDAHDGTGLESSLSCRLLNQWNLDSVDDLVRHLASEDCGPRSIAELAPSVIDEATSGDVVAIRIVSHAASRLSQLVNCVAVNIFEGVKEIPLVLSGGLLAQSTDFRERVLQNLAGLCATIGSTEIVEEPVRGAIRIAKQEAASTTQQKKM